MIQESTLACGGGKPRTPILRSRTRSGESQCELLSFKGRVSIHSGIQSGETLRGAPENRLRQSVTFTTPIDNLQCPLEGPRLRLQLGTGRYRRDLFASVTRRRCIGRQQDPPVWIRADSDLPIYKRRTTHRRLVDRGGIEPALLNSIEGLSPADRRG